MRLLLTSFLVLSIKFSALACFCASSPLCENFEIIETDETVFIFKGSYIQEEALDTYGKAVQYKIENVYLGEVVKPDSPYYNGEAYTNTDSTVWLLSGSSASCLRNLQDTEAIFVLTYGTDWPAPFDSIGYVPTICKSDYFPISDDQTVSGNIWPGGDITMELSDFEELISSGCSTTSIDHSSTNQITIYPNPVTEILNVQIESLEHSWEIELFDVTGKRIDVPNSTSIDMSALDRGVYFLSMNNGSTVRTKKILKI